MILNKTDHVAVEEVDNRGEEDSKPQEELEQAAKAGQIRIRIRTLTRTQTGQEVEVETPAESARMMMRIKGRIRVENWLVGQHGTETWPDFGLYPLLELKLCYLNEKMSSSELLQSIIPMKRKNESKCKNEKLNNDIME